MLDVKWCWGNVFCDAANIILSVSVCHPELVSGYVVSR